MSSLWIGLRGRCPRTPLGPSLFLLSPLSPPTVNPFTVANLKKKRKEKEVAEEGELVPQKEPKQQKTAKGQGRASSVKCKMAEHVVNVRHPTWNPWLELDGAAVSWSSFIREF